MHRRLVVVGILALAALIWRLELFTVSRPGERALPLTSIPAALRKPVALSASLPQVPVGMRNLHTGDGVLVVHFWAPWERQGRAQIAALDSLARTIALVEFAVVCFDPFPSVARYVARHRVRVAVMLDHARTVTRSLPCPSIPYTYVIDAKGRIAVAQAGNVDWLSPKTIHVLNDLTTEIEAASSPGRLTQAFSASNLAFLLLRSPVSLYILGGAH